jgi:hypothetical protein
MLSTSTSCINYNEFIETTALLNHRFLLLSVHIGELDAMLILFLDEASFYLNGQNNNTEQKTCFLYPLFNKYQAA